MDDNEIWKDINGFEGLYQISNTGEVKSLAIKKYFGRYEQERRESILKKNISKYGYYKVVLCRNTLRKTLLVHRLIAQAFIENPENKPTINHKNGIKTDNRIENLEWATIQENTIHAYANGLINTMKGERHHGCILKSEDVIQIRQLSKTVTSSELMSRYGIKYKHLRKIINGNIWKHLPI